MNLDAKQALKLASSSIFIGTPCYGGQICQNSYQSVLQFCDLARQVKMGIEMHTLTNESLIPRGRNLLANNFLNKSTCTHLLFIDADVSFESIEILNLVLADQPVIGASYPKKRINWRMVKEAVLKNPDVDPELLALAGQEHVIKPLPGQQHFDIMNLQEVEYLGTGLMLIKREVLESLRDGVIKDRCFWDTEAQPGLGQRHWDFFPSGLGAQDEYLSEDFRFCKLVREQGHSIWLAPWIRTQHQGVTTFYGDMRAQVDLIGHLPLDNT
jgi:hypothetical protein